MYSTSPGGFELELLESRGCGIFPFTLLAAALESNTWKAVTEHLMNFLVKKRKKEQKREGMAGKVEGNFKKRTVEKSQGRGLIQEG